jgi:DNA-binding winged helix-turn-helix (wHTH) protein
MSAEIKHSYAFDPYLLDPMRGVLMRGDTPVPLSQRSFEALLVLVQHSGAVVSKETLMTTLWPKTYVEEANLAQHISVLRKALGETPQDRRYIVTLSGKGYRFAEPVRIVPTRGHIEELSGESLAQYREFFGIWKDADPDVSVLAQAKAEYAREQSLRDGA